MTIQFNNVSKTYSGHLVLDQISFGVQKGSITALIGPNGSGKTTLIRILLELANADSGKATLLGTNYSSIKQPSSRVSVLLETAGLDPRFTVEKQLYLRTTTVKGKQPNYGELLDAVGLNGCQQKQIKSLSLGMRQRLGLACAISGNHEVYILDEPTNGLDYAGITWLWDLLRKKADTGATIFVTSHHLDELSSAIDTAIGIKAGRFMGEHVISSDPSKSLQDFYRQLDNVNPKTGEEQ